MFVINVLMGREVVIGRYGVLGENDNYDWVYGVCVSFGRSIANAYFQHKDVHVYTWYRYREDRTDKNIIGKLLIERIP